MPVSCPFNPCSMSPNNQVERYFFNVFGVVMRVERHAGEWHLYRISTEGKSSRVLDLVIPAELSATELAIFLDDMFHENASAEHPAVERL